MAEQVMADKTLEAKIAELEEQLRAASERALKAEKERDEIMHAKTWTDPERETLDYPPGFYPSSIHTTVPVFSSVTVGPSVSQSFPGQGEQWRWQDPFTSSHSLPLTTPIVVSTVATTFGQGDAPINPSLANLTLDLGKTQVHTESQHVYSSQGYPAQSSFPELSRVLFPNSSQAPPQFSFGHSTLPGFGAVKTEEPSRDRLSLLEERLRAIEGADPFDPMGPADMCMVPGITMPPNFKIPEFEKYTGIECPKTHLKIYCNKMSEVIHNEPLLIHLFRESLAKHALTWYMGLDRARIRTWRDLSDAFLKQYKFNTEVAPDRSDLQNLEKRDNESVKAYAQRWRELAARISPPLNDKELVSTFVNTFKSPYYTYLISNPSSSFSDMVLVAERVEQGIKSGRIIVPTPETTPKRTPVAKKDVSFVSPQPTHRKPFPPPPPYSSPPPYPSPPPYQHTFFPSPSMPVANVSPQYPTSYPPFPSPPPQMPQPTQPRPYNPPKNPNNQSNRWNQDPLPPLPIPLSEIYKHLLAAGQIAPTPIQPLQPPYPKWYDPNARCVYHAGAPGHTLENCTAFKGKVNHLIRCGWISFEGLAKGPNTTNNPLPNHTQGGGVNAILVEEIVNPSPFVLALPRERLFFALVQGGYLQYSESCSSSCLFCPGARRHGIQDCAIFLQKLEQLVDFGVIRMEKKAQEVKEIGMIGDDIPTPYSFECVSQMGAPPMAPPKLVFKFAQNAPSKDLHAVPFNYGYEVVTTPSFVASPDPIMGETSNVGGMTRSGRCYISNEVEQQRIAKGKNLLFPEKTTEKVQESNLPVTEDDATEFLKIMKQSEFSIIEQLKRTPARISIMELILTSEPHRRALLKVLNEAFVAKDITVEGVGNLIGRIQAMSSITFSEEEIDPAGTGHNKALYITVECKGHVIAKALIDNGSALNVLPKHVLEQLPVDVSHMKPSGMMARAFDGTIREIIGNIDLDVVIGPHTFTITFQVMEIRPAYSMLLGRPWIHSAGAVPSSLHQCIKYVVDGVLITVKAEEALILAKHSSMPYIETTETLESSFQAFEIVNADWIREGSPIPEPTISKAAMMTAKVMIKDGFQFEKGLGARLQGTRDLVCVKSLGDRFGLGYKPSKADFDRVAKEKREKRLAKLFGRPVPSMKMTIPHIRVTFPFAAEVINQGSVMTQAASDFHIHTIGEEEPSCSSFVSVKKSGALVSNWTATVLPDVSL